MPVMMRQGLIIGHLMTGCIVLGSPAAIAAKFKTLRVSSILVFEIPSIFSNRSCVSALSRTGCHLGWKTYRLAVLMSLNRQRSCAHHFKSLSRLFASFMLSENNPLFSRKVLTSCCVGMVVLCTCSAPLSSVQWVKWRSIFFQNRTQNRCSARRWPLTLFAW